MTVSLEVVIERAVEAAFARALGHTIQAKAEAAFAVAFDQGTPFGMRLEEKIEEGVRRFIESGRS